MKFFTGAEEERSVGQGGGSRAGFAEFVRGGDGEFRRGGNEYFSEFAGEKTDLSSGHSR